MVNSVELARIDRQGRIVIPSRLRRMIGIEGEAEVLVRVEGNRIVIEPLARDLEERVKRWLASALSSGVEPLSGDVGESWKWVSREYAERKLGLLP